MTINIAITRTIRPECVEEFEVALREFVEQSLKEPGQLGVRILRPPPGSRTFEYGIYRQFDSTEARDRFHASALFRAWEKKVAVYTVGDRTYEEASGLEAWFIAPGRSMVPPPRWKMAILTFAGVYPLSLLYPAILKPMLPGWPAWCVQALVVALMVLTLTWVVMPKLPHVLRFWLRPEAPSISETKAR